MQQNIRPPAVAGLFYPDSADELKQQVDALLGEAAANLTPEQIKTSPKAMIVPHAGYIYSGFTAASAYIRLNAERIRHVVLLGPVHRVPVRGLALPDTTAFATPLGIIPLNTAGMQAIEHFPQVMTSAAAHQQEHSLEVQLPFLQRVLNNFTLIPLAVGDATANEVAEVLNVLWGDESTLILISSDLSHFHSYAEAQDMDAATAESVLALQSSINHQQACGATPVNGLLSVAKKRHMHASLLDVRNSGDTAGDQNRVVGYASFAFHENENYKGNILLKLARAAISERLGLDSDINSPGDTWLNEPRASFVTLHKSGALRGCIGSLAAHRPLAEDVSANAVAAAFQDPRFAPLSVHEFDTIDIEVSVLSLPESLAPADENDLKDMLRPTIDGVILSYGCQRATFLPQVWAQLPEVGDFLAQLKIKAGLPADFWHPDIKISRYTVEAFSEKPEEAS